ncbi:BEN domain-containing protein 2 [Macrotis lagotis]|uniref:BEN domain-containing protein 2 n=1 Tax=Macrotis lagotis TaxID=92651 RepID=UPI003D69747F
MKNKILASHLCVYLAKRSHRRAAEIPPLPLFLLLGGWVRKGGRRPGGPQLPPGAGAGQDQRGDTRSRGRPGAGQHRAEARRTSGAFRGARWGPLAAGTTAQPQRLKRVRCSRRPSSPFRFNAIFPPHPPVPTESRARGRAETEPERRNMQRQHPDASEEPDEHISLLGNQVVSQIKHPLEIKRNGHNTEETEFLVLHKRRRVASAVENNIMSVQEPNYENSGSVVYEYEPDFECGSVVSEASYTGDYQKTLLEVLNYCQAMYDAIQKLDKKFDLLHGKVSEMQRNRMKPLLLKPRPIGFTYRSSNHVPHGKIQTQKPMERESSIQISPPGQGGPSPSLVVMPPQNHVQTNSVGKSVQTPLKTESQQQGLRQSPPLPTIVSTHSLYQPFTAVADKIPDVSLQSKLVDTVVENTTSAGKCSSVKITMVPTKPEAYVGRNTTVMMGFPSSQENASLSQEVLSSSVCINPSFEYIGDPKRNVKVPGTYLMKARQKTKPKYAARYLVRVLFPKETLLCSIMGVSARGRRTLDPNKVAAIREFLATHFPDYDLSEHGKDWKTCITNVNAMIRCLCCETKIRLRPIGFTYRSSNHVPHGKIQTQKPMERESSIQISPPGQGGPSPSLVVMPPQNHVQTNSVGKSVQTPLKTESQQQGLRQSPPLPTIVSTHSLYQPFTAVADKIPDVSLQSKLVDTVVENTTSAGKCSSVKITMVPTKPEAYVGRNTTVMMGFPSSQENASLSQEVLSSSVCINPSFEYIGDPKRNVKVPGTYLMKARQKTKPKYAARYLVRVLFPKETLLCSIMGVSARGRRTLDPNKVAAIREFLATHFPDYDLSEHGKDWKTCITNVNAMIRCLCCETKIRLEKTENKDKLPVIPESSVSIELIYNNKGGEVSSQGFKKMTALGTNGIQSSTWDTNSLPDVFQASSSKKLSSLEPMQLLGSPWRNVQLPFSVIYVAKGKSRPELSARYLIRHLFTEEVLVKSNVYGSLERGMCPLDSNRIHALRDFLQENYPSYDLTETGYDWKACVAAINSTIRSLRHDHKKATKGFHKNTSMNEKNPS